MFNTVHDVLHKKLISINLRKKAQITKIVGYKPQDIKQVLYNIQSWARDSWLALATTSTRQCVWAFVLSPGCPNGVATEYISKTLSRCCDNGRKCPALLFTLFSVLRFITRTHRYLFTLHSWVRANLHLLLITVLTGQYRIDKLLRMFIGKHLTAATAKPGCRAAPTRVLRRHLSAWSSDHWPLSRGRQELRGPARPIPMCTIMN